MFSETAAPSAPELKESEVKQLEESENQALPMPDEKQLPAKTKFGFFKKYKKQILIGLAVFGGIILTVLVVLGIHTFSTVNKLRDQGQEAQITAKATYTNFKNQDLLATEAELKKLQEQEIGLRQTYDSLGYYKFVPVVRKYYIDGQHAFNAGEAGLRAGLKSVEAIAPYADVLGFAGEGSFTGGTAEDRLKLVLETLDKISPILDEITAELQTVEAELAEIDPQDYPEKIKDQPVRARVEQLLIASETATETMTQYRPILEQLPNIMGAKDERKKYLVLFQNDNELRPTGGFLTAYATIFIENGKVTPEKSDDIYELDQRFYQNIAIPEALGRYLTTERYWNLRDMNISPDFKVSMDQFLEYYLEVPGEPDDIDGVIAVDTEVLTNLLSVLGPVYVEGYGTFSAENDPRCDCPQVVYALSEIITKPTPYLRDDRKGILGPLMRAILTKSYGAPKQQWPELFQVGLASIEGRHTQMYFMDEEAQAAAEAIDAAGRMKYTEGQDFLAIVNANLGGAKSNLFTSYEVKQVVEAPVDGQLEKTVEITYRNSRPADNCNLEAGQLCLNSTLRDWTRLYLPPGSELIDAQGFTEEVKTYDENGFAVIDGFFTLEPNGQAKLKLTYTVPYANEETYRIQLWKQGGITSVETVMEVTGGQEEVLLDQDTLYETPF